MGKIYVLGSLNMDTTYYVEELPVPGMTVSSFRTDKAEGGKGLNQCFAARWCGADTALIGSVGRDEDGCVMLDTLRRYGIDISHIARMDKTTGKAVIFVDKTGRNMIVIDGGANQFVPVEQIKFQKGDWLISQLETNLDAVKGYFKMARNCGAHTILNPSPYRELDSEVIALTDLFIVNECEASMLAGVPMDNVKQILQMKDKFKAKGIRRIVVTLGGEGAVVLDGEESSYIHGIKVKAVDTQGAGDVFAGVLTDSLNNGKTLYEACENANRIAAKCVGIAGSTIVSMSAVKSRM